MVQVIQDAKRKSVSRQVEKPGVNRQGNEPTSDKVTLPAADEVLKRRASLVENLRSYGKENGIQHGTDAGLEVQKALAKELGAPDGYVAALYFSKKRGAISSDGLVRGYIRPLEWKDEKGTGAKFEVDPNKIFGKGSISFTLGGSQINTASARAVMPALVDRPQRVEKSVIAYSKDGSVAIRFDERYPVNEGPRGGTDLSLGAQVYRNGKPIAEGPIATIVAPPNESGILQEKWTWTEGGQPHVATAQVSTSFDKFRNPIRKYQSVTVDNKKLEIWKD